MKELLMIALAFILLDVISGLVSAFANKNVSSSIMRQGLYHKIAEIMLMGVAAVSQYAISYTELAGIVPDMVFQSVVIYVIGMELISILENICKTNPNLKLDVIFKMFNQEKED